MSNSKLPGRASLDYLKRRAKERLRELRGRDPQVKLARAQLAIANEHGFSSWRALKAEIDRRRAPALAAFFAACAAGDGVALRALLAEDAGLVRERDAAGSTGLHLAARHADAVRLLLAHGADVNARDAGDNAHALHFAAGRGALDAVRVLLEAGADVHGTGDVHQLEVIGWAACLGNGVPRDVVDLLLAHGARHHVFSAIALQDGELVQRLCEEDPEALGRRLSRFEQRQSALHYVIAPPDGLIGGGFRTGSHYALLELLIELGADLEAEDDTGRTPLLLAMLRGDQEAMQRLHAAGAKAPAARAMGDFDARIAELGPSVKGLDAMLPVVDLRATIAWYGELGFELAGQHEADGELDWAALALGGVYLMLLPGKGRCHERVSFCLRTSRLDELYRLFEERQLERAAAALAGNDAAPAIRFAAKLHDTHYGSREFHLIDPDGYLLIFSATSDQ
jgi:ankyrin repeat protein/catechol 2,3-dioxygenase-like lactoylglutathione lyase family enzyme